MICEHNVRICQHIHGLFSDSSKIKFLEVFDRANLRSLELIEMFSSCTFLKIVYKMIKLLNTSCCTCWKSFQINFSSTPFVEMKSNSRFRSSSSLASIGVLFSPFDIISEEKAERNKKKRWKFPSSLILLFFTKGENCLLYASTARVLFAALE